MSDTIELECDNCGQRGPPWYAEDSPFEYVKGCPRCQWQCVRCSNCGAEFSYTI